MKKIYSRGFTLIELLVVIAIIGILSSVVLASLNTARGKGADAAVKSNLNNIRSQAELVYDTASGSYSGVCTDPNVIKGLDAASQAGAGNTTADICNNSGTAWAASAPLKTGQTWCVDSTGTAGQRATALGSATVCPAS
ncbi:MAG: type II secretion system protein [Candidatus Paceibacterota bacterium]